MRILPLLATALWGCASAGQPPLPDPAEIPALESELVSSPVSSPTLVRLGVAYRQAGRMEDALGALERAVEQNPRDPAAVFYLGLTYEQLDRPTEARELYERYIEVGASDELKRTLVRRIPALQRQELLVEVRTAVASENLLASTPPEPRTVGVFPFAYRGGDPRYEPLGRALAEMLVTDLSQTDRLTVLERTRIQLLIDEMEFGQSGLVDSPTAARTGRLVGAERIVQGQVDVTAEQLRLEAAVVGTETGVLSSQPLIEEDALQRLFDLQKRLALNLYASLGIQLTPAEIDRVTRVPTRNLEALLAYGRCLQAEDAGRYGEAAANCGRAAALDPGFIEAAQRGEAASETATGLAMSYPQIARLGAGDVAPPSPSVAQAASIGTLDAVQALLPQELPRPAVQEALGTGETVPAGQTTIDLIIRRP